MSAYLPPRENVPIFDSTLFGSSVTSSGGLTEAEADLLYLKWPFGQNNETLNGATTMTGSATVSGDLTAQQNIVMSGVSGTNYIQFPDGSKLYNAAATSNVISTQIFTTSSNITFPAGTQFATIMISGAGGASGNYAYNGVDTTTVGGAGGAGGFVYISRMPQKPSTSMNCVISSGNCVLGYIPIAQTSYVSTSTTLATAFAGTAGTSAVGVGGNPVGGAGGGITVNFSGFGYGLSGGTGGTGQTSSSTPYLVLRGVNYLSTLNQIAQISTTVNPFNYGIGGYSRLNNGATGDVAIQPAGSAVCIVVSYSS